MIIGKPDSGKTRFGAGQLLDIAQARPESPIFLLDPSGSITEDFIRLYHELPADEFQSIDRRVIFDRMGDPEWVVPQPSFSRAYGLSPTEQAARIKTIFENLSESLTTETPIMGGLPIKSTLPNICRLLIAMKGDWQITEAKKLLSNRTWLRVAAKKDGHDAPAAKDYVETYLLPTNETEWERRTQVLRARLTMIEPAQIRARLGYHTPAWTAKEAIERGHIVLCSGERLINLPGAQTFLFMDVFTHILAQINLRIPHRPENKPVLLVADEAPMLIKIPKMAEKIGEISPTYRSRNLEMIIIIQALWQLADNLREQIWSMGNIVSFGLDDFDDAYKISQQLFQYDPDAIIHEPASPTGQPVVKPDRPQYLAGANWFQHMKRRECVMKLYDDDGEKEKYVRYISRTSERPTPVTGYNIDELKEQLLKRRAIPLAEANAVVNARKITQEEIARFTRQGVR